MISSHDYPQEGEPKPAGRPAIRPGYARPATNCVHIPRKADVHEDHGVYRATCRRCDCDLVRTLASRKWYRSGLFG